MRRLGGTLQRLALAAAFGAPLASHAALVMGRGFGTALLLAALQAVAAGVVLWGVLAGRRRVLAVAAPAALLAGLALGAARSPQAGLLAAAGLGHAMVYGALLAVFAASLLPGRTSLVTRLSLRLNPRPPAGMLAYARAVTVAWSVFFAGQLLASAGLLLWAPSGWWQALVTTLHLPLAALRVLGEFAVRRWRFRHDHINSLRDTFRAMRLTGAAAGGAATGPSAAAAGASSPTRGHSGSAAPRPGSAASSAPGPAA